MISTAFLKPSHRTRKHRQIRDFAKPTGPLKTVKTLQDAYEFSQGINSKIGFQKETFQQRFFSTLAIFLSRTVFLATTESQYIEIRRLKVD
jgi:hypothetical protein